jgi:hypothetical protein
MKSNHIDVYPLLASQTCPLHVIMHLQHYNDVFKVQC